MGLSLEYQWTSLAMIAVRATIPPPPGAAPEVRLIKAEYEVRAQASREEYLATFYALAEGLLRHELDEGLLAAGQHIEDPHPEGNPVAVMVIKVMFPDPPSAG